MADNPSRPKRTRKGDLADTPLSGLPSTRAGFKRSTVYILDSQLTSYDYLPDTVVPCGMFNGQEFVYLRSNVVRLKSKQSWRDKHLRQIIAAEKPLRVISRDVGGVARTLDLYSEDQTEPMPNLVASAEHGIPTNEFGCVESSRIPDNAALVEVADLAIAIRVCKGMPGLVWCRCQSGWKRRMPVFSGVVVLKDQEPAVRAAIEAETRRIEDDSLRANEEAALATWRVLLRRIKAEFYIQTVIDRR